MFDFFDSIGIEISAAEEDNGECEEELDDAFMGDLVHEDHGDQEYGCGAKNGNLEFSF
jgi:hypothetical protein